MYQHIQPQFFLFAHHQADFCAHFFQIIEMTDLSTLIGGAGLAYGWRLREGANRGGRKQRQLPFFLLGADTFAEAGMTLGIFGSNRLQPLLYQRIVYAFRTLA